ncbi:MAG: LysM peptidoglycan-binding domain-containing protein [Propionibacteriaceae bacterium]|nr:LysM peptidoglycan-binding domain-containing protein [Propionibacteriaceae bacterium]
MTNKIVAVIRYLTGAGKAITPAELRQLHEAGIAVVFCYETTASRALGGQSAGASDRDSANTALEMLNAPRGTPIYFAIDFDVRPSDMKTVLNYLDACNDLTYPARPYGSADVMNAAQMPGWQTYAWSHGVVSDYAVLYQWKNGQMMGGAPVDYNEIRDHSLLGAWWPSSMTPQVCTDYGAATYVVQPGDTLSHIGTQAGVAWQDIYEINRLIIGPDPNHIEPGQRLVMPPSRPQMPPGIDWQAIYTVQSGDTLSDIAVMTESTVAQLVAWNQGAYPTLITNPNLIQPGWLLKIN